MHMGDVFQRTVERHPERTAVVDRDAGTRYTYEAWNERVDQLAAALRERGIEAGDRVGVVIQPRIQAGTIYWALQKLGAVFTPFNVRAAADELAYLVENTKPDVLFYSSVGRDAVAGSFEHYDDTETLVYVDDNSPDFAEPYNEFLVEETDPLTPAEVDADDTSVILHTSGTTGRPKGVPRSHLNTYTASTAHAIQSQWVDGEVTLGLMPIYHTMGLRALTTSTILSGTWVAQRSFSPQQTLDIVTAEDVTSLYFVPTVFHDLIKYDGVQDADVSSVQRLGYAGTPMTEPVQQTVRETFEPDIFVNHYGSTEVYTYSVCSWLDEKPGSAGRAGINTRVRVVEAVQDETVSPTQMVEQGDLGEIIVDASSPEAFDGYLNRPDANEKSFQDGWFFTGDLGYRDEEGDLFVVGRVDDMIISGGENIYPVEVENVLDANEEVEEVAIVGLDDERLNQVVTAFCTVQDPEGTNFTALAQRLDEFCRDSEDLADFKRPREYIFVDDITKSNVGKVLRRKLDRDALNVEVHESVEV
jgi:2-furoate---CoA ligase